MSSVRTLAHDCNIVTVYCCVLCLWMLEVKKLCGTYYWAYFADPFHNEQSGVDFLVLIMHGSVDNVIIEKAIRGYTTKLETMTAIRRESSSPFS